MGSVASSVGGFLSNAASGIGSAAGNLGGILGQAATGIGSAVGSLGGFGNIANVAGGLLGAYGNSQSGKEASEAARQAIQVADPFAPYRGQYASALSGLYNNPWQIANSPGYQFRLAQGLEGINRNAAAAGYLGSGNRLMEMMRYGQDYGSQEFDKEIARLSGLSGATTGSPAQAGILQAGYANSLGKAYTNTAGAIGSAAGALGDLFGNRSGGTTSAPSSGGGTYFMNLPGGGVMQYYQ